MSRKRKWTDDQLIEAVKNNSSIAGILKEIGLKISGGNYSLIKLKIKHLNINTSHLTGQGWCTKEKEHYKKFIKPRKFTLEEILVKDSYYQCTHTLKKRLLEKNILKNKCYECDIGPEWNNKTLSLQLDHIDGERSNNTIDNLRILCPNCHSQTETFCGKAKKDKRKKEAT
jgi:Zn finger protein HypA/HybF involved in hydrogenase expression